MRIALSVLRALMLDTSLSSRNNLQVVQAVLQALLGITITLLGLLWRHSGIRSA